MIFNWRSLLAGSLLFVGLSANVVQAAEVPDSVENTVEIQAEEIPIIDPTSLTISQKQAKEGDTLKVSFSITNDAYVGLVVINYREPGDRFFTTYYLHKNIETGLYEHTFEITEETYLGEWTVERIYATNGYGQITASYTFANATYDNPTDLSSGHFTVSNNVGPVINGDSFHISQREVMGGDVIAMNLSVTDTDEVVEVLVRYLDPVLRTEREIAFTHQSDTGLFVADFPILDETNTGEWLVTRITAEDAAGNVSTLVNSPIQPEEGTYDFSNVSFTVTAKPEITRPILSYSSHVQTIGWQEYVAEGDLSGTSGMAKRLEGIKISLSESGLTGTIQYRTHVENIGWMNFMENNQFSGTEGEGKRLEAIEIKLTEQLAEKYDIYYRVHAQNFGWLDWAKNGEPAGTAGFAYRLEAIEIRLVDKGEPAPGATKVAFRDSATTPSVNYATHVQNVGWQDSVTNGVVSGTEGEAKRLEGIKISLGNLPHEGNVEYQTHVQNNGWMDWVQNGELSGTEGQAKRLEGIRIKLTGEIADDYDIYYRVHAESYGWLDWAKNGQAAGSEGLGKRLEAIEIRLVEKGYPAPGSTSRPYVLRDASVSYTTHVQNEGWQAYVKDGAMSGTEGQALRLEALKVTISDLAYTGGIEYRTHVQNIGWQDWKTNDQLSGTEGQGLRLEALGIRLTGEIAQHYDVYYRVHAQAFGWMGWAKNGESAGTAGYAYRLEGTEIRLVPKGQAAPGSTANAYREYTPPINSQPDLDTVYVDQDGNGLIKGSVNNIYRIPGSMYYEQTKRVDAWFKTAREAQQAGYRAPEN